MAATRLPPLPSIRDLVKLYKLRAIKQLSQNFLLDEKLTNKIVKAAGRLEGVHVCEVGPGPGGITRSILSRGAAKVTLIEKDMRFKHMLQMLSEAAPGRVQTYWGDVLSFNLSKMFPEEARTPWESDELPPIHLVGNLPFSVATPLIIRWLRDISNRDNAWTYGRVPLTLTFQKEVAERIVADIMDVQRCRLSIMCQYLTEPTYKFTISGNSFIPKPDVDVGVVKFIPRKEPLIKQPFELVEKTTRQLFTMKGRYAWKGLSTLFPTIIRRKLIREMYRRADVNPEIKPPNVTVEEVGRLCGAYASVCEEYPVAEYNYRSHKPDLEWEKKYGHIYGFRQSTLAQLKKEAPVEDGYAFDYDDEELMDYQPQDDLGPEFPKDDCVVMLDSLSYTHSNHTNVK